MNDSKDTRRHSKLIELQKKLNYFFDDEEFLVHALTHGSFANEKGVEENERMEFLGDAVIELVVSEYLYTRFPDFPEGMLSSIRASVVNRRALARRASEIQLGEYLFLGKGEELNGGRKKQSIFANTFEALVAGIYLDSNLEQCRLFIMGQLKGEIEAVLVGKTGKDYKSMFQEYAQVRYDSIPDYLVTSVRGPDHDREFEVTVGINGAVLGKGKGKSKKDAEKAAARDALKSVSSNES